MTKLGDTIMEGLHEIKRLQAGEDTGARRHKVATDKQIEAALTKYRKEWSDESCPLLPEEEDAYKAGYSDAIAATHEQYKPLVEALRGLGDFHVVQGDSAKRLEPNASYNLNSQEAWIVCGKDKSAHRLVKVVDAIKQALAALPEEQTK